MSVHTSEIHTYFRNSEAANMYGAWFPVELDAMGNGYSIEIRYS